MITAGQILGQKGRDVWSVSPDLHVIEALKLMAEKEVGALVVIDSGQIVGIISERDYARKVVLRGRSSLNTLVGQIMSRRVTTVSPSHEIQECMALMTDRHIRHLPVLDGCSIVGIISIGDVVKAIIADQEETIRHLEKYISGVPC